MYHIGLAVGRSTRGLWVARLWVGLVAGAPHGVVELIFFVEEKSRNSSKFTIQDCIVFYTQPVNFLLYYQSQKSTRVHFCTLQDRNLALYFR